MDEESVFWSRIQKKMDWRYFGNILLSFTIRQWQIPADSTLKTEQDVAWTNLWNI